MFELVEAYIEKIANKDIKMIVQVIMEENKEKILYYPAAKTNHHAIRSGLLYHIVRMLELAEKLSEIYPFVNRDLLFAGVILHDIAKIDEMDANPLGMVKDYTAEGQLLGHIVQGIKRVAQVGEQVGADEEISILLQHMILSHHYEPEFGSPKKPMIPEAELLHYIDIIDARMYDMENALMKIEPKQFTERIWVLERSFIKLLLILMMKLQVQWMKQERRNRYVEENERFTACQVVWRTRLFAFGICLTVQATRTGP